jgi:hypothetical protein
MSKKKKGRQPTMESAVKRELKSPLYRMRVVSSINEYTRNRKHKNTDYHINSILKSAINMIVSVRFTATLDARGL